MMVAGGITTLKPVGGLHTNNPGMTQAQYDAQQAAIEAKKAAQQARVDDLVNKLAQQHQANKPTPVDPNAPKRWSVKY
jgi:response regulator of citrate/malate metabolism